MFVLFHPAFTLPGDDIGGGETKRFFTRFVVGWLVFHVLERTSSSSMLYCSTSRIPRLNFASGHALCRAPICAGARR